MLVTSPGGYLKPGESEISGLKRKLTRKLGATVAAYVPDWEVGELVSTWWRPNFDQLQVRIQLSLVSAHLFARVVQYPYVPPHVTKPKECRRMYLIHLPERCESACMREVVFCSLSPGPGSFAVPSNYKLLAVPLFELYDNPLVQCNAAAAPLLPSSWRFVCSAAVRADDLGAPAGIVAVQFRVLVNRHVKQRKRPHWPRRSRCEPRFHGVFNLRVHKIVATTQPLVATTQQTTPHAQKKVVGLVAEKTLRKALFLRGTRCGRRNLMLLF